MSLTTIQADAFRLATLNAIAGSDGLGLDREGLYLTHAAKGGVALTSDEHAAEVESMVSLGWLSKRPGVMNPLKSRYYLTDKGNTILRQAGLL